MSIEKLIEEGSIDKFMWEAASSNDENVAARWLLNAAKKMAANSKIPKTLGAAALEVLRHAIAFLGWFSERDNHDTPRRFFAGLTLGLFRALNPRSAGLSLGMCIREILATPKESQFDYLPSPEIAKDIRNGARNWASRNTGQARSIVAEQAERIRQRRQSAEVNNSIWRPNNISVYVLEGICNALEPEEPAVTLLSLLRS